MLLRYSCAVAVLMVVSPEVVSELNAQNQQGRQSGRQPTQREQTRETRNFFSSGSRFRTPTRRPRPEDSDPRGVDQEDPANEFRSIDGSRNNPSAPLMGTPGTDYWRLAPNGYANGVSNPGTSGLPSAREISNLVCDQTDSIPNDRFLTDMVWQWGQFVDHDIDLTDTAVPLESLPIDVPTGDIFFDPQETGTKTISLFRSEYNADSGTGRNNPRAQINAITAWIDGSNVYGSDEETAASLRSFRQGMLLRSAGNLLPKDDTGFYMAGDVRANEQVGLTAMHTLFMREHNRIAQSMHQRNLELSDEEIYQRARREVIAAIQSITYNEFLPALLGSQAMPQYRGYRPAANSNISNEFAASAYRFGHSMLSSELQRINANGKTISDGPIALQDAFFNPTLLAEHGIDVYLRGLAWQQAQEVDPLIIDDVRNFLFGAPGSGGFDLASLNIQRGRDHGLPSHNMLRVSMGMRPMNSFAEITRDPALQVLLELAYGDVDMIEPWVGCLSENHVAGASVGRTAMVVIRDQFKRLRDADRHWYQLEFDGAALRRIETTTLAKVIRRNTGIRNIQNNVFFMREAQPTTRQPPRPQGRQAFFGR